MSKKLHIVSFDVPYPPNYGGVIDVYYKCKHLFELGIEIELHCFEYGRPKASQLERYCSKVNYYKRKRFVNPLNSAVPYIVKTRIHKQLLANLKADNAPILFEGLHTTWPLIEGSISAARCFVRAHNIEHEYYKRLEAVEKSPFKKMFFNNESKKLKAYENVLKKATSVFAISMFDKNHFAEINKKSIWVSAFHESNTVSIQPGSGNYVLYHGNLAVGENNHAACYLAAEVFSKLKHKAMIVGNNPSKALRKLCLSNEIELLEPENNKEVIELIKNAHINVLPTFQKTGIKLKLLNALFQGRHCLVNDPMIEDTGLESLCDIANDSEAMIKVIDSLWEVPITADEIKKRIQILEKFENKIGARILMESIFI